MCVEICYNKTIQNWQRVVARNISMHSNHQGQPITSPAPNQPCWVRHRSLSPRYHEPQNVGKDHADGVCHWGRTKRQLHIFGLLLLHWPWDGKSTGLIWIARVGNHRCNEEGFLSYRWVNKLLNYRSPHCRSWKHLETSGNHSFPDQIFYKHVFLWDHLPLVSSCSKINQSLAVVAPKSWLSR